MSWTKSSRPSWSSARSTRTCRFFEEAGITVGPVLAMDDLLAHPYMAGRQVVTEFADPDVDAIPAHTPVPRMSRTPGQLNTAAPALGAHTEEVEAETQTQKARTA